MGELDANTLMFFDQHMDALPLYQAFEELLFNSFPLVNKRVQKTQITFSNRHVFSCISFARVKKKAELPEGYMVIFGTCSGENRALSREMDASFCGQQGEGIG